MRCPGKPEAAHCFIWRGHILRKDDIIAGNYKILREIGRGGTGTVFLGYHLHLQKYVVLKETRLAMGDEKIIRTETDILKNLHHPYLPQVYDFLIQGPNVITVLDYVEGNDLSKYPCGAQNRSEDELLRWLGQMAEVLSYLHSSKVPIIHSDIKPGNVIVRPSGDICLIDFNISLAVNNPSKILGYSAQYASPEQYYMAQEMAGGKQPAYDLDPRTDIYSTGALFYYLMTGLVPNCAAPTMPLSEMGDIGYSSALTNIIDKCMQWDRSKRYKDGKELRKVVNQYWKQDDHYKRMLVVKSIFIVIAAICIGAGTYGIYRWHEYNVQESYRNDYAVVAEKLRTGDDDGVEATSLAILGDKRYETYLMESPQDQADLFHALGDVRYNRGDYKSASDYYYKALRLAAETNADLSDYYRDYAIALARSGDPAKARDVLAEAKGKGIAGTALKLIEISCAYMESDYKSCISMAEELTNDSSVDKDSAYEAASFAGMACEKLGEPAKRVEWLRKASEGGNVTYLKMLADAYWQLVSDPYILESQKKVYATESCKIYEQICNNYHITYDNLLNLAIIQYYVEDYTKSWATLDRCIEEYPSKYEEDYHLSMYKAFIYEDTGRMDMAKSEARVALGMIEKSGQVSAGNIESEAVDRLRSLSR